MELTLEVANALLRYEPETGKLFWKNRDVSFFEPGGENCREGKRSQLWAANAWNSRRAGKEITTHGNGYIVLAIFNQRYRAHRVIWFMNTGEWPDNIDHINGVTDDNRMENLRSVTNAENRRNMKRYKRNSSGSTGVRWHKGDQKWQARVTVEGRSVHVGSFDGFDEAVTAWQSSALALGYHPNHGRAA